MMLKWFSVVIGMVQFKYFFGHERAYFFKGIFVLRNVLNTLCYPIHIKNNNISHSRFAILKPNLLLLYLHIFSSCIVHLILSKKLIDIVLYIWRRLECVGVTE